MDACWSDPGDMGTASHRKLPPQERGSAPARPKIVALPKGLEKTPTGITGLDEITNGGLPRGRSVLVCGSAGCGKTMLGLEFLVHGATDYNEPGVFMAFEESEHEL